MTDFSSFFRALWTSEQLPEPQPFPWQIMLAEHAAKGKWPRVINLPTASGKTACLDAAVFGLAAFAGRRTDERLPRRIWFIVDRRIVVDEAFERANRIASKLGAANSGPIQDIAEALRSLSGTGHPLAVARLRGGTWISKDWARRPSQPTIICSTVDQLGSALLFRAYGSSKETASIYAGLAAHDSLIILDEAHCAVPFMQTLDTVARYREEPWAERPMHTPFRCCIMSATPPNTIAEAEAFPKPVERIAALDHPLLLQRIRARKLASLEKPVKGDEHDFVSAAATLAERFNGQIRIAVMVNRVATARKIAAQLRSSLGNTADVVLLTGRMRSLDRDALVDRWADVLKSGSKKSLEKRVIVVTTQCLEVGADFSFDALVTECASLDALRQRFGRLDRLGELAESPAHILIRERDTKPKTDPDPIYGKAIYETWTWLSEQGHSGGDSRVDFGIAAIDGRVDSLRAADAQRFRKLLAPWDDAPVLLPAHMDLLCQTSPNPTPEPDVALFLHGKGMPTPEVRVVFRADLKGDETDIETLSVLPPTSSEMLAVPIYRLKSWLLRNEEEDSYGDVEGSQQYEVSSNSAAPPARKFVIWRGREHSVANRVGSLRPNDVVALRLSSEAISELGQKIDDPEGLGPDRFDLAEQALSRDRGRATLRIHREVLRPLSDYVSVKDLIELAKSEPNREEAQEALRAVLNEHEAIGFLPKWLSVIIAMLHADPRMRIEEHPDGGLILIGRTRVPLVDRDPEEDLFADAEDLTSKARDPVRLQDHTDGVVNIAEDFAGRCVDTGFRDSIVAAAEVHDLGKLDWRFQLLLRGGDWAQMSTSEPLAKSSDMPEQKRRRQEIEEDARLPKGFRHEFLSMQLAEHFALGPADDESRELTLHLVASHHGYARPFAPVVRDKLVAEGRAGDLCLNSMGIKASLSEADRRVITPAHRLDSGVSDRFWRLTRRYGWWGLAYLESVFRLSDWEASRRGTAHQKPTSTAFRTRHSARAVITNRLYLDALDGANPLAFLAALGTLRVLTRVLPEHKPRLSWEQRLGAWRPLLWTEEALDETRLCEVLCNNGLDISTMFSEDLLAATVSLSPKNKKGEASWKDKLKFAVPDFRLFCRIAAASRGCSAEFAATWAGETVPSTEHGTQLALRTRFDFTAGQQPFIGMLRELKESCRAEDLQNSLFNGWRYSAATVSMRWDVQDEKRQYALQSSDPTKSDNPPIADRGANFVAVEALPLFPVVPNRGAQQPGFDGKGEKRSWSWPVWKCPIGLDTVRSLLTLPLTDSDAWGPTDRQQIGISAVFQSRIVMPSGRYRCFTPARTV